MPGNILSYEAIANAVIVILLFCGGFVTLWSCWKIVREIRKPTMDREKKIQELENNVNELEEKVQSNNSHIKTLDETTRLILKSNTVMIEHLISGDHVDNLRKVNDEIRTYLWDTWGMREKD